MRTAAKQNTALRDIGFEAEGFFNHRHLLYRLGECGGQRDANGHNSMRTVDYLQYDFFSPLPARGQLITCTMSNRNDFSNTSQ